MSIIRKTGDQNPKRASDGWTPLHHAAQKGHLEVCKFLMSALVDKNPGNKIRWTPLHSAVKRGHLKICQYFMEAIVDKNPVDQNGWTPLQLAAINDKLEIWEVIVEAISDNEEVKKQMRNELIVNYTLSDSRYTINKKLGTA